MGRKLGADYGRPLDLEELFELAIGPDGESAFDSEAEREAAWRHHGDAVMENAARQPGDRPFGYWLYDVGVEEPPTRLERVLLLHERGLLTDEELRRIRAEAERDHDRYQGHVVVTPREAAERMERMHEAHKAEVKAIAEALDRAESA